MTNASQLLSTESVQGKSWEFQPFPKIPRLFRDCCITEKLDGTNASVHISETDPYEIKVASRNRLISPEDDNFGFAEYVRQNFNEFVKLGPGSHFGEWYGAGIGRGYGMSYRKFALFNTGRFCTRNSLGSHTDKTLIPDIFEVVPIIYQGPFTENAVRLALTALKNGSYARPGYINPEGIVIFHYASRQYFKVTLENDGVPKGKPNPLQQTNKAADWPYGD